MPHSVSVGQRMWYLPDRIHAFHQDPDGNFAWVVGRRRHTGRRDPTDPTKPEEVLEELVGKDLIEHLDIIKRAPDPSQLLSGLVLIRPSRPWPAQVRAVNSDGTVNLDIHCSTGTLHYDKVPVITGAASSISQPRICYPSHEKDEELHHRHLASFVYLRREFKYSTAAPTAKADLPTTEERKKP